MYNHMGIKDFYKYAKHRWPECFVPVPYTHFRFQRIALDMMNILYVYRARSEHEWISQVVLFLLRLRSQFVHPVCVFDGPSHALKQATVDKRREDRDRGKDRMDTLMRALDEYQTTNVVNDVLGAFLKKHPDFVSALTQQPLIQPILEYVQRASRMYQMRFTASDVERLQSILRALGFCVCIARHDGEALCAYLSASGAVEAILSNDSDVFFFGGKKVLFRFWDEGAYLIAREDLLQRMGFTDQQFFEFCLLCGTDFNESVRGIGFCRAFTLLTEYKSIHAANFPVELDHELLQQVQSFTFQDHAPLLHAGYSLPPPEPTSYLFFRHQLNIPDWTYPLSEIVLQEFDSECI